MKIFASILLLLTSVCSADVIQVKQVDLTYRKYFPGGVDPLVTQNGLPNRTLGDYLGLNITSTIADYVYWDNFIHGTTDAYLSPYGGGQFRSIGLQTRLGANLFDWLQLGLWHHSTHILDTTSTLGPFPREDGLELKIKLFEDKYKMKALFF